jgi:hypothetical protein
MTNKEFIESIRLEGEEWKEIPSMEGFYMASTFGRIVSLGRFVNVMNGSVKWNNPRILKQNIYGKYKRVCISIKNEKKYYSVHRLVATTFLPNHLNKPQIDHIDGNKFNNNVLNLRWCTAKENMQNPITKEVNSKSRTGREYPTLRKPVVAIKDGKIYQRFSSLSDVEDYGYRNRCVYRVCVGMRKTYRKMRWMYLSDYEKSLVNQ